MASYGCHACWNNRILATRYQCIGSCLDESIAVVAAVIILIAVVYDDAIQFVTSKKSVTSNVFNGT